MAAFKRIAALVFACMMLCGCENSGQSSVSVSSSAPDPGKTTDISQKAVSAAATETTVDTTVVKSQELPEINTDTEIKKVKNIKGSVSDQGFLLEWDERDDVDGFEIRMFTVGSDDVRIYQNIHKSLSSFTIADIDEGTEAEIEVYAYRYIGDDEEKAYSKSSKRIRLKMPVYSHRIDIKSVCQYAEPALPTGCECTALTTALRYLDTGFDVTKNDIAAKYLKKVKFKKKNGILYGADPEEAFAGSPEDADAYGCYSKPVANAANKYLKEQGSPLRARAQDGEKLSYWFKYINEDKPVLIWATDGLAESLASAQWQTKDGKLITWLHNEHCYVLAGYNKKKGIVYCCDPIDRTTSIKEYDLKLFEKRYKEQGQHAVIIE